MFFTCFGIKNSPKYIHITEPINWRTHSSKAGFGDHISQISLVSTNSPICICCCIWSYAFFQFYCITLSFFHAVIICIFLVLGFCCTNCWVKWQNCQRFGTSISVLVFDLISIYGMWSLSRHKFLHFETEKDNWPVMWSQDFIALFKSQYDQ